MYKQPEGETMADIHPGLRNSVPVTERPGYIQFLHDIALVPTSIADIGACCGASTRALGAAFPSAEIHAWEPVKFSASQITNVIVHNVGLSSVNNAEMTIYTGDDPRLATFNPVEGDGLVRDVLVPLRRLDSYKLLFDFILIDVEGDELRVLYGGTETVSAARAVMLECRLNPGSPNCHALVNHMRLLGFVLHGLYDVQTHGKIKFNMGFVRKA